MPDLARIYLCFTCSILLAGCAAQLVPDAKGFDRHSTTLASCKRPYKLEQDCNLWEGSGRDLLIDGVPSRIAGSADGTIILVRQSVANYWKAAIIDGFKFGFGDSAHTQVNNSFYAAKRVLTAHRISIQRVEALTEFGETAGYFMILDADGYSLLVELRNKDDKQSTPNE